MDSPDVSLSLADTLFYQSGGCPGASDHLHHAHRHIRSRYWAGHRSILSQLVQLSLYGQPGFVKDRLQIIFEQP
jgi:hypothetical protein